MPRSKKTKKKKKGSTTRSDQFKHVFLSFYGKNLKPETITKALRIEPDSYSYPGESHVGKSGKVYSKPAGTWIIYSRLRRNASLENHLKDLLDRLGPHKAIVKKNAHICLCDVTIAVQPAIDVANANYYFYANLINEFTKLGINIHFSFYPPSFPDGD
ncbi:MAG: DUF4279 domain-containing protein [Phycisphaerae bacterium]|jgi:hypothetical protein